MSEIKIKYTIGKKEFDFKNCFVMGVLNVTPDSFSDGGRYLNAEAAAEYAIKMIEDGADIIDIGGESTSPGSEPVSEDEEIERVLPVIEKILNINPEIIISVDTNKSSVAEEALSKGAKIINDISGLTFDPLMPDVVNKYNASLVIMHIKGKPKNMQENPYYNDVVKEVYEFLKNQSALAESQNIKNIFIDPGIGFGKRIEDNFRLIKELNTFTDLNYPLLIGISRKAFIGKTLSLEVDERDTPTAILESTAILNGARIVRTHNTKYGSYVTRLLNKILNY